jgi:hypothetical protein
LLLVSDAEVEQELQLVSEAAAEQESLLVSEAETKYSFLVFVLEKAHAIIQRIVRETMFCH